MTQVVLSTLRTDKDCVLEMPEHTATTLKHRDEVVKVLDDCSTLSTGMLNVCLAKEEYKDMLKREFKVPVGGPS